MKVTKENILREINARAQNSSRILVAVAGPPGSGKSTIAEELAADLGKSVVVLPMDGFHFANDKLEQMGLLDRKGAPETFDADGFVDLIRSIREEKAVSFPKFDRLADCTIPDGGTIDERAKIILVEGNYLLLNTRPWAGLADFFDLTVFLDVAHEKLEARLIERWLDNGLSVEQARNRAQKNDMRNVEFVKKNSFSPDFVIEY